MKKILAGILFYLFEWITLIFQLMFFVACLPLYTALALVVGFDKFHKWAKENK